jgi:mannose-6-phosphate isomerase-like protein (cupin superfamily)
MYYFNESEREHRHGDHGPKYLEQGPRMSFGIVKLQPGNVVSPHVHRLMQESFFILEGCVAMYIRGNSGEDSWNRVELKPGDYIHLEPGEAHKICKEGSEVLRMVVTTAPFAEGDKESIVMENQPQG